MFLANLHLLPGWVDLHHHWLLPWEVCLLPVSCLFTSGLTGSQLFVFFRFNRKSAVSLYLCQLFAYIFFRWNDRSIWISKSSFHSTWSIWRITKTSSPSLFQYFSIKSYWRRWRNLSCLNFSSRKFFVKSFSRKDFPQIDFTKKYFKYEANL